MSEYEYWKSCMDLQKEELEAHQKMLDDGDLVSYRTFRRVVGAEALDKWAKEHNYDPPGTRDGLRLDQDWAVAFVRSEWNGETCYYIDWSAYEFIWRKRAA